MFVGLAFNMVQGRELAPVGVDRVVYVVALVAYSVDRVMRFGGGASWSSTRHFCAAFGVCIATLVGVGLTMSGTPHYGNAALLGSLFVSAVHARSARPTKEIGRGTRRAIYATMALVCLPYAAFVPGRSAVREKFNGAWHVLREQGHDVPAELEREHLADFLELAEQMPGWPKYMQGDDSVLLYPKTFHDAGGHQGVGRSTRVEVSFLTSVPGETPGGADLAASPCVDLVLDVDIIGNRFLPGRVEAVITTHEKPHDSFVIDHWTSLLAEFGVVPSVVITEAK